MLTRAIAYIMPSMASASNPDPKQTPQVTQDAVSSQASSSHRAEAFEKQHSSWEYNRTETYVVPTSPSESAGENSQAQDHPSGWIEGLVRGGEVESDDDPLMLKSGDCSLMDHSNLDGDAQLTSGTPRPKPSRSDSKGEEADDEREGEAEGEGTLSVTLGGNRPQRDILKGRSVMRTALTVGPRTRLSAKQFAFRYPAAAEEDTANGDQQAMDVDVKLVEPKKMIKRRKPRGGGKKITQPRKSQPGKTRSSTNSTRGRPPRKRGHRKAQGSDEESYVDPNASSEAEMSTVNGLGEEDELMGSNASEFSENHQRKNKKAEPFPPLSPSPPPMSVEEHRDYGKMAFRWMSAPHFLPEEAWLSKEEEVEFFLLQEKRRLLLEHEAKKKAREVAIRIRELKIEKAEERRERMLEKKKKAEKKAAVKAASKKRGRPPNKKTQTKTKASKAAKPKGEGKVAARGKGKATTKTTRGSGAADQSVAGPQTRSKGKEKEHAEVQELS